MLGSNRRASQSFHVPSSRARWQSCGCNKPNVAGLGSSGTYLERDAASASAVVGSRVKLATVLDHGRDEEVPQLANEEWRKYHERYSIKMGGPPPQSGRHSQATRLATLSLRQHRASVCRCCHFGPARQWNSMPSETHWCCSGLRRCSATEGADWSIFLQRLEKVFSGPFCTGAIMLNQLSLATCEAYFSHVQQ